ncbi:hypothetical protein OV079_29275 [Nannocystis pusilla]|uniref:Uncharacterized protein n=1 Tax=Nannocystis pusilla TaxID=889268 RepID=A0A9X3ETA6_9BACT|nr:hypothetical protein [Nannocystis pusilla]MCY1009586.1 hypothetical protein [Nannocystis pusilla]
MDQAVGDHEDALADEDERAAVVGGEQLELARINLVESVMHAEVAVLRASGRIEATEGG